MTCGELPVKDTESLDRVIPRASGQHDGSDPHGVLVDNHGSVNLPYAEVLTTGDPAGAWDCWETSWAP